MSHWMFNCKDISKKVSRSMDGTLPIHERMMIAFHLMMCKYCRRFKNQLLIIRQAVQFEEAAGHDPGKPTSLPVEARKRIEQAMLNSLSDQT